MEEQQQQQQGGGCPPLSGSLTHLSDDAVLPEAVAAGEAFRLLGLALLLAPLAAPLLVLALALPLFLGLSIHCPWSYMHLARLHTPEHAPLTWYDLCSSAGDSYVHNYTSLNLHV